MLHEMVASNVAPKALALNSANTILAEGGAIANMTLVDQFGDDDITKLIKTGQWIEVNPEAGLVNFESDWTFDDRLLVFWPTFCNAFWVTSNIDAD